MTKNQKNILWTALRSLFFYLSFSLISTLMGSLMRSDAFLKYVGQFWTNRLYYQVNAVFSLFCLFSIASVFALHDPRLKERFSALSGPAKSRNISFGILRHPFFWVEFAVFAIMSFALSGMSPVRDILRGYLSQINIPFGAKRLLASLIFMALFLIIGFIARFSTIKWWLQQKRKKEAKGKLPPQFKLALEIAKTAIIWSFGGWAMSIVFPVLTSIVVILGYLCIPIIIVIICIFFIKYFRAIYIRAKFIKNLKAVCKRERLGLAIVGHPYRTIFIPDHGPHITIGTHEVSYACRFVGIANSRTPMFLLDDGYASYGGQQVLFKHIIYESFTFDAAENERKVLIACPVPRALYARHTRFDGAERQLDVGDRVLDYSVYNASGFLNALERNCL